MDRPTFTDITVEDHVPNGKSELVREMINDIDSETEDKFSELERVVGQHESLSSIDGTKLSDEEISRAFDIIESLHEFLDPYWDDVTEEIGNSTNNPIIITLSDLFDEVTNCFVSLLDEKEIRELVEMIQTDSCLECGSEMSSSFTTVNSTPVRLVECSACDAEYPIPTQRLKRFDLV